MSTWTHYRAKVAALSRDRRPDDPELLEARCNLRAAILHRQVVRALTDYPPLTVSDRQDLAELLLTGGAA